MPHRRSQATVTQFLRDALAVDELGVAELEARARATGLLGDGSPSRDFFGETASQKTPDTGLTSIRAAWPRETINRSLYIGLLNLRSASVEIRTRS